MTKFDDRVDRLVSKIGSSKTPVPGLIMGLSGTDSIVAFLLCYEAMQEHGIENRLYGIHFIERHAHEQLTHLTWFRKHIIPWLSEQCPAASITFNVPYSETNDEEDRWHTLSKLAKDHNCWIAGCVNATEKALGTYSIWNKSASIWPVATLWKTDILKICADKQVPEIAMQKSRLPDCLCGREELAAENIELIDEILQFKIDPTQHDPELLRKLYEWIRYTKHEYDFKDRTPYMI